MTSYGKEGRSRSARRQLAHTTHVDGFGREHVRVQGAVRGPQGKGTVHADAYKGDGGMGVRVPRRGRGARSGGGGAAAGGAVHHATGGGVNVAMGSRVEIDARTSSCSIEGIVIAITRRRHPPPRGELTTIWKKSSSPCANRTSLLALVASSDESGGDATRGSCPRRSSVAGARAEVGRTLGDVVASWRGRGGRLGRSRARGRRVSSRVVVPRVGGRFSGRGEGRRRRRGRRVARGGRRPRVSRRRVGLLVRRHPARAFLARGGPAHGAPLAA